MTTTTIILGIIAILLVILFVWLLLREPRTVKPVETKPVEKIAAMPAVSPPEPDSLPVVPEVANEPAVEVVPAVPADMAAATDAEPAIVTKAAGPGDDLEIIEGIGPKIAAVLKQAGVTTFTQLAAMTPERITEILHAANLRLADPKSWPEQARLAAAGDQAGLQALQDRLKAGREV